MQSKIIIPPPLQPGDLLRVIAPSGTLRELEPFKRGVEIWRDRGYRLEVIPEIDDRWGYLAGKDKDRRDRLKFAWEDSECKGILCARGGFGSTRILEDWSWIQENPKWLIGFSDITALLWSLYKVGISGVHAPVLTTIATEPEWSIKRLFDWVEGRSIGELKGKGLGGGVVSGILLPANLTVATHLIGTPYQPEFDNVILAIEDVGEAPYRIDRMLTQWRMSGILGKVKGIAVGRFSQCEAPANIPSFKIEEVLQERLGDLSLGDLNIPIVSELPFGHDGCNASLPVGVMATLDGNNGLLMIND
ncbi:S66 peptidase family protein [Brunnivagina elsteri]|uniref:LD-carboxypeptidase n=1 Tax=Brunnivagina elsteri CCALA 953 TaxID=987040 RepID=A0A2A2TN48_9CYAN|nr:LD-carboxypeptidase [Calothrix elsteri]PAX59941.1 LD-carboxypeptidase [Calothrix elsteri CCALA 953]